MAPDYLKDSSVSQVAGWYRRLAAAWERGAPELQPALAGVFLRTWVDNRNPGATYTFDAPTHVRSSRAVVDVQIYHRSVFLTEKKGRVGKDEKWVGILPRIQQLPGFKAWDMQGDLPLEYQSLCDVAPNLWAITKIQNTGTNAERDILGSLRGFQLKSSVRVTATRRKVPDGTNPPKGGPPVDISFKTWSCSATDRYDWNYSEWLTVKNPDYLSAAKDATMPKEMEITVYYKNAQWLESAGEAAPYDLALKPWLISDARVVGNATIDIERNL